MCRGDAFRVDFAHLGEVRSLIPRHVNVMALTATVATRKAVLHRMGIRRGGSHSQQRKPDLRSQGEAFN